MNNTYIKGRITKGEFVSELFKQRVESLGGTYEANDCLVNSLNSLTDKEFKDAKLILTPNGYIVDKLPTIKPNGGGDATIVRNVVKTRVNSSGLIESLPANVLAPDYLNGVCPALNVEGQATNLCIHSDPASLTNSSNVLFAANDWGIGSVLQNKMIFENQTTNSATTSNLGTIDTNFIHRISCFAKKTDGQKPVLYPTSTDFVPFLTNNADPTIDAWFDDSSSSASRMFDRIEIPLKNNVWFFSFKIEESNASARSLRILKSIDNSSNTVEITGINYIKQGKKYESYIPTNGGRVTRTADNVTLPIPAGTTEIIEKYEDGTTNTITTIPTSPYTVPVGRYEYILMK